MSSGETLVSFGFTALESEIYVFLLKESPATGYRIAQGLNKPAANTYKGIQTLQTKGAILVEEGPSRLCRAVPLDELMNRLQKDFESRRKDAEKKLKSLGKPAEDERIYQLRSRDQILNRIREMLAVSKTSALLRLPAFGVHAIEGDIEKAADRGVAISVLTNESMFIEGVEVVTGDEGAAEGLMVVTDANQTLAGFIPADGESEAVWTRNPTLAKGHHVGLSAEIALAHVSKLLADDEKRSRIIRAVENRRKLP
jgi:HTH-type transcriptional regulator, sugar sensing transcriptional regulator